MCFEFAGRDGPRNTVIAGETLMVVVLLDFQGFRLATLVSPLGVFELKSRAIATFDVAVKVKGCAKW
ncbi:hypothetical protein HDE80_001133 [Rhodanobacter sp. A1T4]|nr:hypothetical protein [Rhodanobacter sp. A1T4]